MARDRIAAADAASAVVKAVYAEHGRAMRAYATRLLGGDAVAAEDIVQETLVRLWRHPEVLDNGWGTVLRGWLLTVVRNLVIDRHRKLAARPPEVAETSAEAHPVQHDHAEFVTTALTLAAALNRLSPEQRATVTEVYVRDRSLAEAAELLGIPRATVKSRLYHALRALRADLKPPSEEDEGIRP